MKYKQIITILDLPTLDNIIEQVSEFKNYNNDTHYYLIIDYINKILIKYIKNKQDFINLYLNESINIVCYNLLIQISHYYQFNEINNNILFTNTCEILYYKINNNIYNLYNFVENNLINEFNTILLTYLLTIYYFPNCKYSDFNNDWKKYFIDNYLIKLYLFKYNQDLPINIELNKLIIQINNLNIQINDLNIQINKFKIQKYELLICYIIIIIIIIILLLIQLIY